MLATLLVAATVAAAPPRPFLLARLDCDPAPMRAASAAVPHGAGSPRKRPCGPIQA